MTNSDSNSTSTLKLLSPHWTPLQDIPQAPQSYGAPKKIHHLFCKQVSFPLVLNWERFHHYLPDLELTTNFFLSLYGYIQLIHQQILQIPIIKRTLDLSSYLFPSTLPYFVSPMKVSPTPIASFYCQSNSPNIFTSLFCLKMFHDSP